MEKKTIISKEELKDYEDAKYEVTTVIPYVKNPVKVVNIFNQEELDDYLTGYEEYGEFIVKVERLKSKATPEPRTTALTRRKLEDNGKQAVGILKEEKKG